MTTVVADIAALSFDSTETAKAAMEGASLVNLKATATQLAYDLASNLETMASFASTNEAAIDTIQAKLIASAP